METKLESAQNAASIDKASILNGLDYYKLTMSQFFYEHEPHVDATLTFQNRSQDRLSEHVRPYELKAALSNIGARGFTEQDISYLSTLTHSDGASVFSDRYLHFLQSNALPRVFVSKNVRTGDLAIETTGRWALASLWETIVMREVSEQYNRHFVDANWWMPSSKNRMYDEGNYRLDHTISLLRKNPDLKIMEFGTRRAYSPDWHLHVLGRLATEAPRNLVGTSNVGFARLTGKQPLGTFAHEAPMGWAALADVRGESIQASHGKLLDKWYDYYGKEYAVALSDTFGSQFFFDDFGKRRATNWRGIRHDSGDPYQTGREQVAMYQRYGLDPREHTAVFSDALTVEKALALHREFGGVLLDIYGIGTSLTSDVGIKPRNHVMKATWFFDRRLEKGAGAVKLSDDAGKHTGSPHMIRKYQREFA